MATRETVKEIMNSTQAATPNLLVPALIIVLAALAFAVGALWQRVEFMQKGGATAATANTTGAANPAAGQAPAQVTVTQDQIKGVFGKQVIKLGDANSKLLIVEVADPSCPYCHAAAGKDPELNTQLGSQFTLSTSGGTYIAPVPEIKKLVDQKKAAFAYVFFPGHGNGEMGAKALYCAQDMGKFWEAHDLLMSNKGYNLMNTDVKNDTTKSGTVATFLGAVVDQGKMKACLDSGKYDQVLKDNTQLSQSLGAQGTPGFFLNTTAFNGAYNFKDMQSAVDSALK